MIKILLIHGPNLNLLGRREREIYGEKSLEEINRELEKRARELGAELEIFQSNHEGEIVDKIAQTDAQGILINPAAYTHTSVAIRDAIKGVGLPAVEVHLSNIFAREPFRHTSLTGGVCIGVITGFGVDSYVLGLEALVRHIKKDKQ